MDSESERNALGSENSMYQIVIKGLENSRKARGWPLLLTS